MEKDLRDAILPIEMQVMLFRRGMIGKLSEVLERLCDKYKRRKFLFAVIRSAEKENDQAQMREAFNHLEDDE